MERRWRKNSGAVVSRVMAAEEDWFDDEIAAAREAMQRGEYGEGISHSPRLFVYACRESDIPADGSRGKAVELDEREVALFRLGGRVHAISNICPHEMSPLLAVGSVDLDSCTVTCPLHGWVFNIETGEQVGATGHVPVYEVKVVDGEVWVAEP